MSWALTLNYADGTSEVAQVRPTREDARELGRWYRTHCELGRPRSVVSTRVARVA